MTNCKMLIIHTVDADEWYCYYCPYPGQRDGR